ncbi:MAG TPA: transcription elongation factor [Candidatus Didemnitutus sp.]|nr:transcription elongation factor [Candidatus Didemnitutus sp.]
MNKQEIFAAILRHLQAELSRLTEAALSTHAEATHEENKAEDKYDTRGLEASYLAHGQSKAAEEAAQAVAQFQALPLRNFSPGDPVSLGALVTIESRSSSCYFIGPRAGGTEVKFDGIEVMVITPQSPLGRQLLGRRQGDQLQLDLGGRKTDCRVSAVI